MNQRNQGNPTFFKTAGQPKGRPHGAQPGRPERLLPRPPGRTGKNESILHFACENYAPDVTMLLLTRDRNDFDYPSIHQKLSAYSVELHFSAGDCIKRLRELASCNL